MARKETEYQLAIRIKANMDKTFNTNLLKAESGVKKFGSNLSDAFNKLDAAYDKVTNGLGNIAKATGVAAAAVTGVAAKAGKEIFETGKEFESAFAGVKKTVDATDAEFANLRTNILDMSKEMPTAASEIAGVMEIAGQLGIANDSLVDFTETMINLGVSTNLSAAEAADSLARFANITQMDAKYYENLGSVVVDLGNHFATTESEIVGMATRLAATGEMMNLTEPEIMAMATALSSLGIEEESGGTAMNKLLKRLQLVVEEDKEVMKDYAKVAGITKEEFANLWNDNKLQAVAKFTEGLSKIEGDSAIKVLDEMGLKEVRLSNAVLALSTGGSTLTDALGMANKAWNENNALSEEAAKRYETMDSKLQTLKNTLEVVKIQSYDTLRTYFAGGIEWAREKLEKLGSWINGRDGLSSWIERAQAKLPKITSGVKKFTSHFEPIAKKGMEVMKYAVQHPDALAKIFIGVGTALVSYKILSNVNGVVTGITTLFSNPVMIGIAGLTAAIGGVAWVISDLKQKEAELIQGDLEAHFGNIALSMSDISDAAEHLLNGDGSLDKLHSAIEEWTKSDNFLSDAEKIQKQIDKFNWKVHVGIGLKDSEIENYKDDISSFIDACNNYIEQENYALNLSLSMFIDGYAGSELQSNITNYGSMLQGNMEALGKQLANYVNQAFSDDVLDEEEVTKIAEKMQKMADLQYSMAVGRQEASLKMLGLDTNYSNLTPESFKALLEKTNEIENQAAQERREAYLNAYTGLAGRFAGKENTQEYKDAIEALDQGYYKLETEAKLKTSQFAIEAIKKAYGDELQALNDLQINFPIGITRLKESATGKTDAESYFQTLTSGIMNDINDTLDSFGGDVQGAASQLMNLLMPTTYDMQAAYDSYKAAGGKTIQGVEDALTDANNLKVLTGSYQSMWEYILEKSDSTENSAYRELIQFMYEKGAEIPQAYYDSVIKHTEELFGDYTGGNTGKEETYRQNRYNAEMRGSHNATYDMFTLHASGGIFGKAHMGIVAENGPESIIPLNGSSREAKLLWKRTGELLGLKGRFSDLDDIGGGGYEVHYSPTIVFNGAAPSKEDLDAANDRAQEKFESMIEDYFRRRAKLAF